MCCHPPIHHASGDDVTVEGKTNLAAPTVDWDQITNHTSLLLTNENFEDNNTKEKEPADQFSGWFVLTANQAD